MFLLPCLALPLYLHWKALSPVSVMPFYITTSQCFLPDTQCSSMHIAMSLHLSSYDTPSGLSCPKTCIIMTRHLPHMPLRLPRHAHPPAGSCHATCRHNLTPVLLRTSSIPHTPIHLISHTHPPALPCYITYINMSLHLPNLHVSSKHIP